MNHKLNIKIVNFDKSQNWLSHETWTDILQNNDPQIAYDYFITKLQNNIKINTSIRKLKNKNVNIKPWITTAIVNSIRYGAQLKKRLLQCYSN